MGTDPYANKEHAGDPQAGLQVFKQVVRISGGMVGVAAMLVGVVYGGKILKLLFNILSAQGMGQPILDLAELLGGTELSLPTEFGSIPLAMPLAAGIFVVALLVVGWLALGLITTGAKVVSFCLADRESMKELLVYALGKNPPITGKDETPEPVL
jgi:hypothetical protein